MNTFGIILWFLAAPFAGASSYSFQHLVGAQQEQHQRVIQRANQMTAERQQRTRLFCDQVAGRKPIKDSEDAKWKDLMQQAQVSQQKTPRGGQSDGWREIMEEVRTIEIAYLGWSGLFRLILAIERIQGTRQAIEFTLGWTDKSAPERYFHLQWSRDGKLHGYTHRWGEPLILIPFVTPCASKDGEGMKLTLNLIVGGRRESKDLTVDDVIGKPRCVRASWPRGA